MVTPILFKSCAWISNSVLGSAECNLKGAVEIERTTVDVSPNDAEHVVIYGDERFDFYNTYIF